MWGLMRWRRGIRVCVLSALDLFLNPVILVGYELTNGLSSGSLAKKESLGRDVSPGEMPDGTHRKSVAEGMPSGFGFGRKNTASNGEKSGGFRERMKDKFRSKK
jgi:hypothetical protein